MIPRAISDTPLLYRFKIFHAAFFLLYAIALVAFYFLFAEPYLRAGDITAPRLLADSVTYLDICRDGVSFEQWYWLRDAGPCISLQLLVQSVGLVTFMNVLAMTIPAFYMARAFRVRAFDIIFVLLVNPMSFLSLFGPNKEVFGVACVMSLMIFLQSNSKSSLVATLFFALFARLPMLAVILAFLLLAKATNLDQKDSRLLRSFRKLTLLSVISISIVAMAFGEQTQLQMLGDVSSADDNSKSTLISLSMEPYASNGLFILTYIVRVLLNIFGAIPNLTSVSFDTHGVYYVIGVTGSSCLFLFLFMIYFFRNGFSRPVMGRAVLPIYAFVIFSTMALSLSPVIQHRYFYPFFPILVLFSVSRRLERMAPAAHKNHCTHEKQLLNN